MTTPPCSSTQPLTKAIVTGHTRGLGAALAEQLLARGIAVLGVSRSRHPTLAARFAGMLDEVVLDLTDLTRVGAWLADGGLRNFSREAHRVLLINNAGTVQPIGPCDVQEAGEIARAVSLNVATPLMFTSAFASASAQASDRRVAHISSGAARNAYAGWSIYCATKAALDHHARSVALDEGRALRICSVAPGLVDTDMQAEIRGALPDRFPLRERFEALKHSGQLATPEQSAKQLIDYVLSDAFGEVSVADVRELPQH